MPPRKPLPSVPQASGRLTAEIDPTLYRRMREYIDATGTTIKYVVEQSISAYLDLADQSEHERAQLIALATFDLDPNDPASLARYEELRSHLHQPSAA